MTGNHFKASLLSKTAFFFRHGSLLFPLSDCHLKLLKEDFQGDIRVRKEKKKAHEDVVKIWSLCCQGVLHSSGGGGGDSGNGRGDS